MRAIYVVSQHELITVRSLVNMRHRCVTHKHVSRTGDTRLCQGFQWMRLHHHTVTPAHFSSSSTSLFCLVTFEKYVSQAVNGSLSAMLFAHNQLLSMARKGYQNILTGRKMSGLNMSFFRRDIISEACTKWTIFGPSKQWRGNGRI